MNSYSLAFLLIFGFGHPSREPLDPAKSIPLHSRLKCDGTGDPEDLLRIQTTIPHGDWAREFVVSEFQTDKCSVETMFQCWHKARAGWRSVWSTDNSEASAHALVPVSSCFEWGSNAPAQYVLSGWYREGVSDSRVAWKQAALKKISTEPEVYEFTDPNGGKARLEIRR